MNQPNKHAVNFFNLAKRCLSEGARNGLAEYSSYGEELSFHKLHIELMKRSKDRDRERLADYYPFIKLKGKWCVAVVRMYNYLISAQHAIATFEDEHMQSVFDAIQAAKKYTEEYKAMDEKLTPHDFDNWEEYQEKLSRLYEEHMMVQASIFGRLSAVTPSL